MHSQSRNPFDSQIRNPFVVDKTMDKTHDETLKEKQDSVFLVKTLKSLTNHQKNMKQEEVNKHTFEAVAIQADAIYMKLRSLIEMQETLQNHMQESSAGQSAGVLRLNSLDDAEEMVQCSKNLIEQQITKLRKKLDVCKETTNKTETAKRAEAEIQSIANKLDNILNPVHVDVVPPQLDKSAKSKNLEEQSQFVEYENSDMKLDINKLTEGIQKFTESHDAALSDHKQLNEALFGYNNVLAVYKAHSEKYHALEIKNDETTNEKNYLFEKNTHLEKENDALRTLVKQQEQINKKLQATIAKQDKDIADVQEPTGTSKKEHHKKGHQEVKRLNKLLKDKELIIEQLLCLKNEKKKLKF